MSLLKYTNNNNAITDKGVKGPTGLQGYGGPPGVGGVDGLAGIFGPQGLAGTKVDIAFSDDANSSYMTIDSTMGNGELVNVNGQQIKLVKLGHCIFDDPSKITEVKILAKADTNNNLRGSKFFLINRTTNDSNGKNVVAGKPLGTVVKETFSGTGLEKDFKIVNLAVTSTNFPQIESILEVWALIEFIDAELLEDSYLNVAYMSII